jgi:DNA polymerase III delta subunit
MASENALGFLRAIAQGRAPAAVVLIAGPQPFLREYVLEAVRKRTTPEGFEYRPIQVGGNDGFAAVVSELEAPDLFAPKRLIACRVLKTFRDRGGGSGTDDESDGDGERTSGKGGGDDRALAAAIERMPAQLRLVVTYERDNAPAKMRRLVEKIGVVVSCMRPFENQVPLYVELFARSLNLKLSMNTVDLLIGRHGSDLAAIANAIAKGAINCGDRGKIAEADLDESGSSRIPDIFELAESVARGNPGETLALFDRAIETGRDPIELLAVEVIPMLRRMLVAASLIARRKGVGDIASALGLPATSGLLTRAVDGARRLGLAPLRRAHQRACELDASFKMGLTKERELAVAAMLVELIGGPT